MNNNKGKFIVFEGIDGSGKTTQINKLCEYLESKGRKVYVTSEPTISLTGGMLRDALSGVSKRTSCEMAAMFVLDRIAHNTDSENGICAITDKGFDLISDRYYYSTLAYQGQTTSYAWVKAMNTLCPEIKRPDLCIYLDLLPEQSLARIKGRGEAVEIYENEETLTRVRNAFFSVFDDLKCTDRIAIVDAYRPSEEIAEEIFALVNSL